MRKINFQKRNQNDKSAFALKNQRLSIKFIGRSKNDHQIKATDKEINLLVNKLYDVTDKEQKIIERNNT